MRIVLVAGAVLALTVPATADAAPSRLSGTWAGTMKPTGSGIERSYAFRITIDRNGRTGTWRAGRCRGTLRFLRRSGGFALFRETLVSGPCTGKGTNWVKRDGKRLTVSFKSAAGRAFNSRGTLSRRGRS